MDLADVNGVDLDTQWQFLLPRAATGSACTEGLAQLRPLASSCADEDPLCGPKSLHIPFAREAAACRQVHRAKQLSLIHI